MKDLKEITREVCRIARRAGTYLREVRKDFEFDRIEQKHSHDYVSYADKGSERQVIEALRQLLPEAGFVAEEGSASYHGERYRWVIDPLDGTTNFIHNYVPYAVSIALRCDDEILVGVVYEVQKDECFSAWKGGGAYLNGRPISVSSNPLDRALIGIELPYDAGTYTDSACRLIRRFYGKVSGIRMNGSAAISLCDVAAGRIDGWMERYICPWDFSAGAIIITEAGGQVTDYTGSEAYLDGNNIVASNGRIHADLVMGTLNE